METQQTDYAMSAVERIQSHLAFLYGPEQAQAAWENIQARLDRFHSAGCQKMEAPDQKDSILITYGDSFQQAGQPPLQTLDAFLREQVQSLISGVHILPFYPYSSDDGFSVIDYRSVDPRLGRWADVTQIGQHKRLMFDAVINHISAHSCWFEQFKLGQAPYQDYFITPQPDWDLRNVVRPRTLPLLTEVETAAGPQKVWTTFSADQIDLNYANPQVLLEIIDLLLFYVEQGAGLIRLDAIAYLWKAPGTRCLHLPQTHTVIKLMRAVLDLAAPDVLLITETNVPHRENISYFGSLDPTTRRTDEAQMVYQFPLAPLVLNALYSGSAAHLSRWAAGLNSPGIFFNFLASHDGIGVLPALNILSQSEIDALVQTTLDHGGQVSNRSNPDGTHSPYELNITFFDALNDPANPQPDDIDRFIAAQAIMLSLSGVPGIYMHSLFGARNWTDGMKQSGRARTINRAAYDYPQLKSRLAEASTREAQVFSAFCRLLALRKDQPALHPLGAQRVLEGNPHVFALERTSPDGAQALLCLINVSAAEQKLQLDLPSPTVDWLDLISGQTFRCSENQLSLALSPYQVRWLRPKAFDA